MLTVVCNQLRRIIIVKLLIKINNYNICQHVKSYDEMLGCIRIAQAVILPTLTSISGSGVIPEPGSMLLLGIGMSALALGRQKMMRGA